MLTLKLNRTLHLDGGGKSKRSFIYITDVCKATYKLCIKSKNGEIYHISTPRLTSIKDLVYMIFKLKKISPKNFIKTSSDRIGKDNLYSLSSRKIKKELKWKPEITLKEGLLKTLDWVERNINVLKNQSENYIHKK